MIGEAVGNYRVVAKLGSGSMGVVFLGEHRRIARRAAIKLLAPELVVDQLALQRFFNEARATSLIRHPGIVDVFDCDVDASGRAYMVMEHLEGETLAERICQLGQLHWTEACLIAGQVADAVGAAHDKGIIHRDLKPDNVFLVAGARDRHGTVKVLDFGVAKLLAADPAARVTMRGMLLGTPEYMSPEQCGGAEAIDHRADIYALGCILFEMLTGEPPFVASDLHELVVAHRFRPAPSAAAVGADLPPWLDDALARMLAKQPEQRPSTMHEVAQLLRRPQPAASALTLTVSSEREVRNAAPAAGGRVIAAVRRVASRRAEVMFVLGAVLVLAAAGLSVHRHARVGRAAAIRGPTTVVATPPPPDVPRGPTPPADPPPALRTADPPARPTRRARPPLSPPRSGKDIDGIVDL